MSAMNDHLVDFVETVMVERGIEYSPEAWDRIMDEMMTPPAGTVLPARTEDGLRAKARAQLVLIATTVALLLAAGFIPQAW